MVGTNSFVQSLTSWVQTVIYGSGAVIATGILLLYVYQEKLLYHPTIPGTSKKTTDNPEGYRSPGEYSINYEDIFITAKDGTKTHAWFMKWDETKHKPTVIFFHGNAGNIGYRLPNAVVMFKHLHCNILLVDYRGFGLSEGEPTEHGIKLDAEAAVDYLHNRPEVDSSKILLFGRSLGGAVAFHLAHKVPNKIAGIIVENTFLSISKMVDQVLPWLKHLKTVILRIEWNCESQLDKLTIPIMCVAGLSDELVPHWHMQRIYELTKSSKLREWYPVAGGTHNDTWNRGGMDYFHAMRKFIEKACSTDLLQVCPSNVPIDKIESTIPNMLEKPIFSSHLDNKKDA